MIDRSTVRRTACASLAALALVTLAPEAAAIGRTFVASFGLDTNACSLSSPCRGFTAALVQTDPGGEIVVLDSAGYGAVTIGKSVSIVVPAGIYAGISVLSGDGITVNGAGINVTLQGLTINGQGGAHGVRFVQGARLNVAGCQISSMGGNGVRVEGTGTVVVTRTSIVGSGQEGVFVNAAAKVSVVRSRISSSAGTGIEMTGGANGTVTRALVSDSGLFGIEALQTTAGTTRIAIDDTTITDNDTGTGVYAEGSGASAIAQIHMTNSLITRNFNGVFAFSQGGGTATIGSTGNDVVENLQTGVSTVTTGSTTIAAASRNGVFRNAVAGFLQSSGSLFTPCTTNPCGGTPVFTNYVSDNAGGDNFGATPDPSLK
ncbi:MAG: right-handed parallel beta-helix repeat-containing protein [Casimicrobiaceae bacterium]